VLCVHGGDVASAIGLAGPDHLTGKLVLDTTNPLDAGGPHGAHKPVSIPDSCLQVAQRAAPGAHLVKAWNCTPGVSMVDPEQAGGGTQFLCGDDDGAKKQAADLLHDFGWDSIDVGDSSMAPYVEGMALAVINHGIRSGSWDWVLKLNR